MNLNSLLIPARHARLFGEIESFSQVADGNISEDVYEVPASFLLEMFLRLGAKIDSEDRKVNELQPGSLSKVNSGRLVVDNQEDGTNLPQALVEMWGKDGGNWFRALLTYQNLPLKEVAKRYGGKSAAANLANYLSKSDEELGQMRDGTMRRLAEALGCPLRWLELMKSGKATGAEAGQ